jgi:hypothetical protein
MKTISYKNTHYVVFDINDGDKFTLSPTQASISNDDTVKIKKQNSSDQEDKDKLILDIISSYSASNKEKVDFLYRIVKDRGTIVKLIIEDELSFDEIMKLAYKGIL